MRTILKHLRNRSSLRRAQVIVRQAEAATSSPMLLRTPMALMASSITASMARSDVYENLARRTKLQRTWGDCYGYVLVATGRAEVMLDSAIKPWDIAPMLPILQEAGGPFTDWRGEPTVWGKDAVATNGHLHNTVLQILKAEKARQ